MNTNTELIARSVRVASELDYHNANLDRRARTCIRELVAALKSMEQAITDPENQPSQFGTVLLATHQALEAEVERLTMALHCYQVAIETAEESLKDRVALAMEVDRLSAAGVSHCGHRPPCIECRKYAAPIPQQPAEPRPVYGKPGTRDVDVAEAMKRWDAAQQVAGAATDLIDILCARIKAADDAVADNDYMLDSDDCIAVIRGTWKPPLLNDKPVAPQPKEKQ